MALLLVGETCLVLKVRGRCERFEDLTLILVVEIVGCAVGKVEPPNALTICLVILELI